MAGCISHFPQRPWWLLAQQYCVPSVTGVDFQQLLLGRCIFVASLFHLSLAFNLRTVEKVEEAARVYTEYCHASTGKCIFIKIYKKRQPPHAYKYTSKCRQSLKDLMLAYALQHEAKSCQVSTKYLFIAGYLLRYFRCETVAFQHKAQAR